MSPRTMLMFALAGIAALVWVLRFVPAIGMPDVGDFFGGVAIGLAFGAAIGWLGERTPK